VLTIFSTPKPFDDGHIGIIQRNALMSWKRLHPEVEVILFGDESGTAEVCKELGLRHEPDVERTGERTKLVRSIFEPAQRLARHEILCYSNCDIILGKDFAEAIRRVSNWTGRFLMVGRRWDSDIAASIDFSDPLWEEKIREYVLREGIQRLYYNIDYFAFSKGIYADIPPLAIGRVWWDHWLIWKASEQKADVVDASDVVLAMHQNHDYSYHPQGVTGVWHGEGAQQNFKAAGGFRHLKTLEDATHRLTPQSIKPRRFYRLTPARRAVRRVVKIVRDATRVHFLHPMYDATRSVRHALGLHARNLQFRTKKAIRRHEFDR
jgi:hypothetical protein